MENKPSETRLKESRSPLLFLRFEVLPKAEALSIDRFEEYGHAQTMNAEVNIPKLPRGIPTVKPGEKTHAFFAEVLVSFLITQRAFNGISTYVKRWRGLLNMSYCNAKMYVAEHVCINARFMC